jgi:hypothetical protein
MNDDFDTESDILPDWLIIVVGVFVILPAAIIWIVFL